MSRITYNSEDQVREVAQQLRSHQVPTDVIHLDTGWFETDWRSDYQFFNFALSRSGKDDRRFEAAGISRQSLAIHLLHQQERSLERDGAKGYHVRNEGGATSV